MYSGIPVLLGMAVLLNTASPEATTQKALIEFGWDEPGTAFLREHIREMERTPFDGCVFHVNYAKPDGQQGSFTWECWGQRTFTQAELQPALEDLQATDFGSFTHNFLRFNVTPGDVDWFGDFSAVLANATLAAQLAHDAHIPGILFDIEQYNSALFHYAILKERNGKSWQASAKQVRKRGREVMQAFQAGYPDITIFLTFGYCLPWGQTTRSGKPLAEVDYGLLAPFLDGMVDGANGQAMLVDGHESSYGYRDPSLFAEAYQKMAQGLLPIVANAEKYRETFQFGFGVWMDHDWRKYGWDPKVIEPNYYSPEAFKQSLSAALTATDKYVWIYTEQPRWWTPEGGMSKLPDAYVQATVEAKAGQAR